MTMQSRDDFYLELTRLIATRSDCITRKVGAVATKNGAQIGAAYNGALSGLKRCDAGGCPRCTERHTKGLKSGEGLDQCLCMHAESRLVSLAARDGIALDHAEVWITTQPCISCLKLLIDAGVSSIVFDEPYTEMPRTLQTQGISIRRFGNVFIR